MKNGKSNIHCGGHSPHGYSLRTILLLISATLLVFTGCKMGGTRVNPNSSGAIRIIRTSDAPNEKEEKVASVPPKGAVVKSKPKITPQELPPPPTPTPVVSPIPPTVNKNKVEVLVKPKEDKPTKQPSVKEKAFAANAWLEERRELILYYLVAGTVLFLFWLVWSIGSEKERVEKRVKKALTEPAVKPRKKGTKKGAKKSIKKPAAKKAAKKTAKKKALKKKS